MRLKLAAAIVAASLLLTGCWDMRELNSRIFVLGIGIDSSDIGGYDFTFYSTDGGSFSSTTLNAPSLAPAIRDFEERSSNSIDLEHLSCVALGRDIANGDFMPLLDYLYRKQRVRRQCQIAAVDGKAQSLFSNTQENAASAAANLLESFDSSQGGQPLVSLNTLYVALRNNEGKYLYLLDTSDEKPKINGILAYDKNSFTGSLSMDEAELSLFLVNGQTRGLISCVHTDGEPSYYSVSNSNCSRQVSINNDRLEYNYALSITVSLVDGNAQITRRHAQEAIERELEGELILLARRCASLGGEVIGMQSDTRTQQPVWYESHRELYTDYLSHADISVTVSCIIDEAGDSA